MIHIATIHWKSAKWIDLQLSMLQRYISEPFRVYAYLTDIPQEYHQRFYKVLEAGDPGHAEKLNALSNQILNVAADDDWIMFIDGDAFPVSPLVPRIQDYLKNSPLTAIQRLDNLGEKHAHPAFCITTVRFWNEIHGDWSKGYQWINDLNVTETDVGGNLLFALTERNVTWTPLHRSNKLDIIPVCYGIYGDLIYHHGAGFRSGMPRGILHKAGVFHIYRRLDARLLKNIVSGRMLKKVRESWVHPEGRLKRRLKQELELLDIEVTETLFRDPILFIELLRSGDMQRSFKRLKFL